jgi:hypothetical protein
VCWVFLLTLIYPLLTGESLTEIFAWSYARAINALYFGGFVALIFTLPDAIIYFMYSKIKKRFVEIENTNLHKLIISFVLSLPLVLTVFILTVLPPGSLGPFWKEGFDMAMMVLIATYPAIYFAKFLVNSIKSNPGVTT